MDITKDDLRAELQKAQKITAKALAAGRDSLTPAEEDEFNAHLKAYEALKTARAAQPPKSADQKSKEGAQLKALLASLGDEPELNEYGRVKNPGRRYGNKASGRGHEWALKAAEAMETRGLAKVGTDDGAKALISGSISVPNILDGGRPVEIDAPKRTLLDLVGRGTPRDGRAGNEYAYLRQTTRTNRAAAIADGRTKPKSDYGMGEVRDHYRTYVNKTEDLPYRYLADYETLVDVVKEQLAEDTMVAIEADMLSGPGPDAVAGTDAFVGILETVGIQVQAWSTDLLTTLSNAKHKFLSQGLELNGWVLNPSDLQTLELMRENGATGPFLFPSRKAIEDFLGAPAVPSLGMPAGKALAGDFDQAELIPLNDDELVVDTGKRTTNNTFLLMYEGRYGFRVRKPTAFVEVETAD